MFAITFFFFMIYFPGDDDYHSNLREFLPPQCVRSSLVITTFVTQDEITLSLFYVPTFTQEFTGICWRVCERREKKMKWKMEHDDKKENYVARCGE